MELKSQQYSRKAFERVNNIVEKIKQDKEKLKKYRTFAKRFPSLIHTCGLEQAVSFAESKEKDYRLNFDDLEYVLQKTNVLQEGESLTSYSKTVALPIYLRLSKEALIVAGWLKKYTEALTEGLVED